MKKSLILISIFSVILISNSCVLVKVNRIRNCSKISSFKEPTTIPFELKGHIILIKASVNNSTKKHDFIFDTGAMTMVSENFSKEIGLKLKKGLPTPDKRKDTHIGKLDSINIEDLCVNNVTIGVMDVFGDSLPYNAVGFLGANIFKNLVVSIDYDRKELILSRKEINKIAESKYFETNITCHPVLSWPFIESHLKGDKLTTTKAMIDAGMPYDIVLPVSYVDRLYTQNSSNVVKSAGVFMEWPFWKTDTNYVSRLEKITVGDLEVKNVIVFFANTGGNVLLGKSFFDKFITHIDFIRKKVVFEQKHKLNYTNNLYTCGVYIQKEENKFFVEAILENTSADKNNLQAEYEVLEFNSVNTKNITLKEIRKQLNDNKISEIKLKIKDLENIEREILLKKRFLFSEIIN